MPQNKKGSFEFLKRACYKNPNCWRIEACNLFQSAQVLLEFSNIQTIDAFSVKKRLSEIFSNKTAGINFWADGVIRMLWGYGFENILKGIYIQQYKTNNPKATTIPLDQIIGHDLIKLFKKVHIENLSKEEKFYLRMIEKCSVVFGRYPLPNTHEKMYEGEEIISSEKNPFKESLESFKKGEKIKKLSEFNSIHCGIDRKEKAIINSLKDRLFKIFDNVAS